MACADVGRARLFYFEPYLLLPRIGKNSAEALGLHWILAVVNPDADQAEEAMAYLECMARHNMTTCFLRT